MEEQNEQISTTSGKSSNSNLILMIVILVVIGVAGWLIYNQSSTQPANTIMQEESPVVDTSTVSGTQDTLALPSATETDGEVKVFEIEGGSFYYKPNEIRVKKGDQVKITLTSVDMMHDFVIDELEVRTPILSSGKSGTVEFTADQAGTYEFYCSVGEHRVRGMVGKLIVD